MAARRVAGPTWISGPATAGAGLAARPGCRAAGFTHFSTGRSAVRNAGVTGGTTSASCPRRRYASGPGLQAGTSGPYMTAMQRGSCSLRLGEERAPDPTAVIVDARTLESTPESGGEMITEPPQVCRRLGGLSFQAATGAV